MTSVSLEGISKAFGSVVALENVDFRATAGKVQALVGENGAGKTTLMKALYGEQPADSGRILLDGKEIRPRRASEAQSLGIGMVSQHYAIIPELTCLQNLILGAETSELLNAAWDEERARHLAQKMGFHFNWKEPASRLSPGDSQKLEILKLLWRNSEVMILDEPTAMLSPADSDSLYASLKDLAREGACVIVVTHRISEVLEHCSDVTVLRGGKLIDSRPTDGLDPKTLAELIVGHGLPESTPSEPTPGATLLELRDASAKGDRGNIAVNKASLTLREGEVVGIAGVDGSGQKELFEAIMGIRPIFGGTMSMGGAPAPVRPADRIEKGIRLVPEDRLEQAVIPGKSLEWNSMLGIHQMPDFRKGPWVDFEGRTKFADKAAKLFSTRFRDLRQPVSDLSGGNQQRFVVGRALASGPKIILAFQPTRGLDIDGTARIYAEIRRICREEKAGALVVSFDLDELLENADRIVVLCGGDLHAPKAGHERDRASIGELMVGATA